MKRLIMLVMLAMSVAFSANAAPRTIVDFDIVGLNDGIAAFYIASDGTVWKERFPVFTCIEYSASANISRTGTTMVQVASMPMGVVPVKISGTKGNYFWGGGRTVAYVLGSDGAVWSLQSTTELDWENMDSGSYDLEWVRLEIAIPDSQ